MTYSGGGLLDFRYVMSSAIMSKKSNSLPVAGLERPVGWNRK